MSAQHTPGPWAWNHNGGKAFEGHLIFGDGECVGAASNDANARLIAAAPELLASCERLLAILAPFTALCVQNAGDIETARAAIAKAKGEA